MIRVGIIGLGSIAQRVAAGVTFAEHATLQAVASRDYAKAVAFKERFDAVVAYDSYQKLMEDERVDMVYICTPNALHYEHIHMALAHHKHVLCEKPFVSTMKQLEECFLYAKQQHCFLMEAEKTLFTPLNEKLKTMVEEGQIGRLQYIEASYGYQLDKQKVGDDFWGYRKEDGGCMYDVGVYPLCYANYFADASIENMQCMKEDASRGYTQFAQVLLKYENGVKASVRSAWNMKMINVGYLYGDEGVIITENFWKNTSAKLIKDGVSTSIEVTMKSDFSGEIDHAAKCIEAGWLESPILNQAASTEIMRVLEFVKQS